MSSSIESVTASTVALALDAASLRQQAIAANIANHSTVGYIPQTLDFASQMMEARRSLEANGSVDEAALAAVRLELQPELDANGQPVKIELDTEMAALAENATQYQVLVKGLNRHFAILSTAVNDGKR
jgi:flagellar basal-body rod protein FlgB